MNLSYYYYIVNSAHVNYRILVNDIDLDSEILGRNTSFEMALNQLLIPELNKIEVILMNCEGKTDAPDINWRFMLELYYRIPGMDADNDIKLLELEKIRFQDEIENILPNGLMGTFIVPEKFETVLVKKNPDKIKIDSYSQASDLVLKAYRKVQKWVINRDVESLVASSEIKIKEVSRLLFMTEHEYKSIAREFYKKLFSNSNANIVDFSDLDVIVRYSEDIYYGVNIYEKSPIILYDEIENMTTYIDFRFTFDINGFNIVR